MGMSRLWLWVRKTVLRRHGTLKSFEHEVQSSGGMAGSRDIGTMPVPVEKIVGSVGRAHNLRTDFFHRSGWTMTARYRRIGEAMKAGRPLPAVDLYKVRRGPGDAGCSPASEYYVVDGHHRVAMARRLGQAYLDAAVVEYRVAGTDPAPGTAAGRDSESPEVPPADAAATDADPGSEGDGDDR